jgi:hypothetical protein
MAVMSPMEKELRELLRQRMSSGQGSGLLFASYNDVPDGVFCFFPDGHVLDGLDSDDVENGDLLYDIIVNNEDISFGIATSHTEQYVMPATAYDSDAEHGLKMQDIDDFYRYRFDGMTSLWVIYVDGMHLMPRDERAPEPKVSEPKAADVVEKRPPRTTDILFI